MPNLSIPMHCGRSGRKIEFIEYTGSEKVKKIVSIIRYPNEEENLDLSEIAIFCCTNKSLRRISSELFEYNIPTTFVNSDNFLQETNRVRISTLHSAKGLEFRAVLLINIETELMDFKCNNPELKNKIAAKLLYVGMTRAYDCLFFIYNPNKEANSIFKELV